MKKRIDSPTFVLLCVAFALLLAAGCTKEEVLIQDFIKLSENAYTFNASGEDKLTIAVDASATWNVDMDVDAEWLTKETQAENSITLTASPNQEKNTRNTELLFSSGKATTKITIQQMGTDPSFSNYTLLEEFNGGISCSPNGTYIGGIRFQTNGKTQCLTTIRINTYTGKRDTLQIGPTSLSIQAISDNGILVCLDQKENPFCFDANGRLSKLNVPSDYKYPSVNAISSDGSLMVGYAKKTATNKFVPGKWMNGVFEELPVPTLNILEEETDNPYTNFCAKGCSQDGSVIYGSEMYTTRAIYWKDGKVDWIGKDVAKKKHIVTGGNSWWKDEYDEIEQPRIRNTNSAISPNGKYITGIHHRYDITEEKTKYLYHPFVFDTTTGKTTLITDFPNDAPDGGEGLAASNEGDVSYTTYEKIFNGVIPVKIPAAGFVYNIGTGTSRTTSEYIKKEYGIELVKANTYIYKYSPDKHLIFGNTREESLIGIKMPSWLIKR